MALTEIERQEEANRLKNDLTNQKRILSKNRNELDVLVKAGSDHKEVETKLKTVEVLLEGCMDLRTPFMDVVHESHKEYYDKYFRDLQTINQQAIDAAHQYLNHGREDEFYDLADQNQSELPPDEGVEIQGTGQAGQTEETPSPRNEESPGGDREPTR